ncbi:HAD family hydrolase [Streptomyces seoulensis]|uniref:HAD family hydrolase n=1 Tax=Streptomyces seoulensis TaxID=73044 RepID=UPI003C2BE139
MDLRATLGLSDAPGDLCHEYVDGFARSVCCFPGAREGLDALRGEGWTLGIATSGVGDIQRTKLAATDLAPLFDGIYVSGEVEVRKPARGLLKLRSLAQRWRVDGWGQPRGGHARGEDRVGGEQP